MEANMRTKIYFGDKLASIYEVGFLSTDFSQIIAFSELLEKNKFEDAEKYFGEKATSFNRYSSLYELKGKADIVDVKKGSVELIAKLTLAASIIIPYVILMLRRDYEKRNEQVDLRVSPEDHYLMRCLDGLEGGKIKNFQHLLGLLRRNNYNVEPLAKNAMLIEHMTKKYVQKMVRTIKKN